MTYPTPPMLHVWDDIAESHHNITETRRLVDIGQQELGIATDDYRVQPTIEQVRVQAHLALDLASAARQYARDLSKMYVLIGGTEPTEEAA